ncbi:hypothetical protein LTR28_012260, partial [Elasticomyces elasticus]
MDDLGKETSSNSSRDAQLLKITEFSADPNPVRTTPVTLDSIDGGRNAWLQVFGGFLVCFNVWGYSMAYGAFQSFYELQFLPEHSASSLSWIGTFQGALLVLVGVIAGPLFDVGYYVILVYAGSFLLVFGIMMLSLSTTYWEVFLSQGLCMGLGSGLLYIPSLALVALSFERKRSLAMGIVTSGIAL